MVVATVLLLLALPASAWALTTQTRSFKRMQPYSVWQAAVTGNATAQFGSTTHTAYLKPTNVRVKGLISGTHSYTHYSELAYHCGSGAKKIAQGPWHSVNLSCSSSKTVTVSSVSAKCSSGTLHVDWREVVFLNTYHRHAGSVATFG